MQCRINSISENHDNMVFLCNMDSVAMFPIVLDVTSIPFNNHKLQTSLGPTADVVVDRLYPPVTLIPSLPV